MKKILYVEDDPINALVIQRLLKGFFYVQHVQDGETCMALLQTKSFDVILMDINLGKGKMDGVETLHSIRSNSKFRTMRVIAVTSYALPEDEERFLREGFDAYLPKPVDRQQLITTINHHIG